MKIRNPRWLKRWWSWIRFRHALQRRLFGCPYCEERFKHGHSLEVIYAALNLVGKARTDLREQGYYDKRKPS